MKQVLSLAMLAACVLPLPADDISLVRVGEAWRYLRGTNEPSAPVAAWRQAVFEDAQWATGASGFSLLAGEATVIGASPPVRSVYFRKSFSLAEPAAVRWLVLRLDYSSGFVAYLNGSEVLRRELAEDPVPFNAYAASRRTPGTAAEFDLSAHTALLVPGENLLALQVHVAAGSPSTLVCVPELLANFQRGPAVANPTPEDIQVTWRTPVPADSTIEFGLSQELDQVAAEPALTTNHALTLTGLTAGTQYYYRVRSRAEGNEAVSPLFSFRTAKPAGEVSFAVFGDSGGGSLVQARLARVIAGLGVDLVLHAGDLLYPFFTPGYADTRLLSVYGPHQRSVPYYFTFGNHELYGGSDQFYLDALYLPTNAASGTEHYYSFDQGDVHFVCLFVPTLIVNSLTLPHLLYPGSVQYGWLTNDLAVSAKPWKVVWMHSPLFDSSLHRFDDANGNQEPDRMELQGMLLPVLGRYGVRAVFSGHSHDYERFVPAQGVHAFVSGGGGYTLYAVSQHDRQSAQFRMVYHCLRVLVSGDTMRVEAIDTNGVVMDTTTIRRAPPPPQVWDSAWAVARLAQGPADDGDGNIAGQTFGLAGQPIPAIAGQSANLGEALVNNDATYLRVGLRHCMIGDAANIFLFIESPHLAGRTSLAGVGNGIVDPTGQGVDGLDFLENLAFTNFTPSVACVLGDEFADGQFRSFQRPGQGWDPGQGVFRLDSALSDVPGAQLQQYNLSPQAFPQGLQGYQDEQHADYVEVLVPLQALGGLRPGELIKLGAVVADGAVDLEPGVREIDAGFLGQRLHGAGGGPVVLEGVTVRLAEAPSPVDSDADGLPDWWELAYGMSPTSGQGDDGALGDPDADGMTNLSEFQAGTHPDTATSALRLEARGLGPGRLRLTWQTVPGRSYHLEYALGLAGAVLFKPLPDPMLPRLASSTTDSLEVDLAALEVGATGHFFRARVLP
jgi:hypothetical protein